MKYNQPIECDECGDLIAYTTGGNYLPSIICNGCKEELNRTCSACNGSGFYDDNGNPSCDACNGTGWTRGY